jgi:hypothetical protein
MSAMRNCRDSFLHYIADNLPSFTVHNIRVDKSDPKLNQIMLNAINITFHNTDIMGPSMLSQCLVTVDVINDYELTALDEAEQVANLLFKNATSSLMDFTDPTAPVIVPGGQIFWNLAMPFKTVHSDNFYHMSALLNLLVLFPSTP